ncbi:MAG: tyrosine-type recombinase/integrase [Clostridia bacterium]
MHNHFKRFLKQSAVGNYNFHSLRHTFATNYIEAGYDYKSLSEILGHSNVKITLERYVHSSNELKRNNIEKLVENLLYLPSELPSAQSILTV